MEWISGQDYEVFGMRMTLVRASWDFRNASWTGEFTGEGITAKCDLSALGEPKPVAPRLTAPAPADVPRWMTEAFQAAKEKQ